MIQIHCIGRSATVTATRRLTSGTVGAVCEFTFDDAWEGLRKIAVFQAGDTRRDMYLTDNRCLIPWEVLTEPHVELYAGVYGSDTAGTVVLPTEYVSLGEIYPGADPVGNEGSAPTLTVIDQIIATANHAQSVAQSVRDDADAGHFNGEKGDKGDKGDPYTPPTLTSTQKTAIKNLCDDYLSQRSLCQYDYNGIRNIYAKEGAEEAAFSGGKLRIDCNLFAQNIWMGRSVTDYIDAGAAKIGTYSSAITKAFHWGYYFRFPHRAVYGLMNENAGGGAAPYYGFHDTDPLTHKDAYSYNTHYNENAPNQWKQSFNTYMDAGDMAYELYQGGYEIAWKDADVGDLVFFRTPSLVDGSSDSFEQGNFRNISHVAVVYRKAADGTVTFAECTDTGSTIITCSLSFVEDAYGKCRAADLENRIVMVARHPAAYGKGGNVPAAITEI